MMSRNIEGPAGIYNKLKQVEFNEDDSGNPHTWAVVSQINSYVNQAINGDKLAYYIAPHNFSFDNEESMKMIAQHISRRISKDNDIVTDYKSDKPVIVISNTATVLAKDPTGVDTQGGSHWVGWVLLPKKYNSLSGKEINNDKYQVLFFDSLGHKSFPEGLKKFLTEDVEITEETEEGKRQIKLVPFCRKEEIDFRDLNDLTGQQMNGSDCGWWVVYYVLMTVYTGKVEFLEPLKGKKLSAKPLRSTMDLQEDIIHSNVDSLKSEIRSYLGEDFLLDAIFADSLRIYSGSYNKSIIKFAVLTDEKDSQDQQIVRCYTIAKRENFPGSRFTEKEKKLVEEKLPSSNTEKVKQAFAWEEHKLSAETGTKKKKVKEKHFSVEKAFAGKVDTCSNFKELTKSVSTRETTKKSIQNSKLYAYKFLQDLFRIEMSPDVLIDIIIDDEDSKTTIVGRPKLLGSSRKQMRHVIPYSSLKCAIEAAVVAEKGVGYLYHIKNILEIVKPLIRSKEGVCLTAEQYKKLQDHVVSSDGFEFTTETQEGQQRKYHLICNGEFIDAFNKVDNNLFSKDKKQEAHNNFYKKFEKYINHRVDCLIDILDTKDPTTITMICEGIARVILTMFNQDKYAAFPEEGNSLLEEVRLYNSKDDEEKARKLKLQEQIKQELFKVMLHDEITQEINNQNIKDYDLRIRIVNNEGSIVKRTASALSTLNSLLSAESDGFDVQKLNDYNEKYNFAIKIGATDLTNYNQIINKDNLCEVLYYHVAKHLYAVFDFKPLEAKVLAPRQRGDETIKVYPSSTSATTADYSVQEGKDYRELQVNSAKGYNDKAMFRSKMDNQQMQNILSSKIISHVIIHLMPYEQLRTGFIGNATEEELESGTLKVLDSFITLVRQDYINAPFYKDIAEVLNDNWAAQILKRYKEQDESFFGESSMVVDGSISSPLKGKGVEKDIDKGGSMKKSKNNLQRALGERHSGFLARGMSNNNADYITQRVEDILMKDDDQITGGKISKVAFYEAEKSLITEYIIGNKLDRIPILLDAIHNERFKDKDKEKYKELKTKEYEVLRDGVKMADRFLEEGDPIYKDLKDLLEKRLNESKGIESLDRSRVSTLISEALSIVQINSASSSKSK